MNFSWFHKDSIFAKLLRLLKSIIDFLFVCFHVTLYLCLTGYWVFIPKRKPNKCPCSFQQWIKQRQLYSVIKYEWTLCLQLQWYGWRCRGLGFFCIIVSFSFVMLWLEMLLSLILETHHSLTREETKKDNKVCWNLKLALSNRTKGHWSKGIQKETKWCELYTSKGFKRNNKKIMIWIFLGRL